MASVLQPRVRGPGNTVATDLADVALPGSVKRVTGLETKGGQEVEYLDRSTGRLSWDAAFKDPGATAPGVSYHRGSWPNGVKGMAMPHGALFVP